VAERENLLVVVDPTAENFPIIDRVVSIAKYFPDNPPKVTIMTAVDYSHVDPAATNEAVYRDDEWIKSLAAPLLELDIDLSLRISWSQDWADSIMYSAEKVGATSILLPHPGQEGRQKLSDEFWYLVRNAQLPIALFQSTRTPEKKPIVVAMDVRDEKISDLNKRILDFGKLAGSEYGSSVHLVHVYQDSMQYPDRARIVEKTGLPNENIHFKMGDIGEKLAEVVGEIGAGMVVIGATRRSGIRAALRGRKINNIMQTIDHDLVVIV
jgi:universal stress protein E